MINFINKTDTKYINLPTLFFVGGQEELSNLTKLMRKPEEDVLAVLCFEKNILMERGKISLCGGDIVTDAFLSKLPKEQAQSLDVRSGAAGIINPLWFYSEDPGYTPEDKREERVRHLQNEGKFIAPVRNACSFLNKCFDNKIPDVREILPESEKEIYALLEQIETNMKDYAELQKNIIIYHNLVQIK